MGIYFNSYDELTQEQKQFVDEAMKFFEGKPVADAEKVVSVIRYLIECRSVIKSLSQ